MRFNYQARTEEGQVQSGIIEAASKDSALSLLQAHGLYVTFLEAVREEPFYARRIRFFERVSRKDLMNFSRQLAVMFRSKIPLVEALQVLAAQTKSSIFQEKILKISEEVEAGTPFSQALGHHPKTFSSLYINTVKAGEASGTLDRSLDYLADHLEREYHLYSKLRGAMIYPVMVVMVMIAVVLIMLVFVIPKFAEIFEAAGQELPLTTRVVIAFSDFLVSFWWLILAGVAGAAVSIFWYFRQPGGRKFLNKFILKIPLFGSLLKAVYLARFAENLSTLIAGGLPIARALEIAGEASGNDLYREAIFLTADQVRRGEQISASLSRFKDLFSPMFIQMTMVGEKTGTLDKTLAGVVNFYRGEVERAVENLLSIIEPVLIVFLGLVVAGIMLSILMPIYQMTAI
jgi:type IV pilus assembly protein PilC